MTNLEKAKKLLLSENYTCVLCNGDSIHTSVLRGVKPLVQWKEQDLSVQGFSAADKVIGKATAFLYVLLGISKVYAGVISRPALAVLQEYGVYTEYGTLVDNIINRAGDGICPFEASVMDICRPEEAYMAIRRKMQDMNISI